MKFVDEILPGAHVVKLNRFQDARGSFVKTYVRSVFDEVLARMEGDDSFEFREEFYSVSAKNVIRGMHFQLPPHDHIKLVYCAHGAVIDVLLDLRRGAGYGKVASLMLNADEPSLLLIPKGVAHGFHSLTDESLMIYKTSSEHALAYDAGIRYDSFDFDWPSSQPVISDRDRNHPSFASFDSPFGTP